MSYLLLCAKTIQLRRWRQPFVLHPLCCAVYPEVVSVFSLASIGWRRGLEFGHFSRKREDCDLFIEAIGLASQLDSACQRLGWAPSRKQKREQATRSPNASRPLMRPRIREAFGLRAACRRFEMGLRAARMASTQHACRQPCASLHGPFGIPCRKCPNSSPRLHRMGARETRPGDCVPTNNFGIHVFCAAGEFYLGRASLGA